MQTLTAQLRSWQRREWLSRAAWGFARWAALVLTVLAAACLGDWLLDRYTDVPFALRVAVTACQLGLAAGAAYLLLVRLHVPSLDALAGRAEEAIPAAGHRFVTALQLNRPGAATAGMSPALIRAVTQEAEALSRQHRLAALADATPAKRAAALLVPVLVVCGGFAAARPELTAALLSRQALLPVEIPRAVRVVNSTPDLWPSGDEVELRFDVTGPVPDDAVGYATVRPEGQPDDVVPVALKQRADDTHAVFAAKLPPSSAPFEFRAYVGGGRMRGVGRVRFAPRPVVTEVAAWVLLPAYVDPAGKNRYERAQPQGEVVALPGSSVRVEVATSKPVTAATVVLFARDEAGAEHEAGRVPLRLAAGGLTAGATFGLPPRPSGYRVEVVDENGFGNGHPPRRGINLAPDDPPRVSLLAESVKDPDEGGPVDDFDMTGMPVLPSGQIQIGYAAKSPIGVDRARVMYRVNDGPWVPLPLKRTDADVAKVGAFVPELGLFRKSGESGQVEFYPVPSPDPDMVPPGLEAGGRINFQVGGLVKVLPDGKTAKLEVGDRVELYVEAFDRNPAPGRPPGRSESRIKTVVTPGQLQSWLSDRNQSVERLRKLEEGQRGVFGPRPPGR